MSDTILKTATPAGSAARSGGARGDEAAGAPVRCAVRVPVMLDVMGGIAELTGALALAIPSSETVRVAVAPRQDQCLSVARGDLTGEALAERNGHASEAVWPLAGFYEGDALAAPATLGQRLAALSCTVQQAAVSGAYALLRGRIAAHLSGGFTVVVQTSRPAGGACDAHFLAAVQDATCAALAHALGAAADGKRIAEACRSAACLGLATGFMTQAGPLLGKPGELLQVCCGSGDVRASFPLPAGVTLLGVDCAALHPQAPQKYSAAFTAALMGREIIARLMPKVCPKAPWDGMLARVSVTDFVDELRDRIPTKLKGVQFLDRFPAPIGAPAPVEPGVTYKVRSRAEHHIYEEDRVRQFAERLVRARRTGEELPVREAGEFMYASHWSYGQRCGLGSIESDYLVGLLRSAGPSQGIYGARVSGTGCGGTVVVLLRDNAAAHETVGRALDAYRARFKRTPLLRPIADSSAPGFRVELPA